MRKDLVPIIPMPGMMLIARCEATAADVLARLPQVATLDEARDIQNMLRVMEEAAKRAQGQLTAQNELARARIHTEATIGELSLEIEKQAGKRTDLGADKTPLQGLGVDKSQLARFRQLARMGFELREACMYKQIEAGLAISTVATINLGRETKRNEKIQTLDEAAQDAKAPLDGLVLLGRMQDQLSVIEDESVDLVLTDPPYGLGPNAEIGFQSREPMSKTAGQWDALDIHLQFKEWIHILDRVMRPAASMYIFVADAHIGRMWATIETQGFQVRNLLTWQKLNPPPMVRKRHWGWGSEHIIYATKSDDYTFNWLGHHEMLNIIQCPICAGTERLDHPTQKPVKLLERMIRVSSNPGDTILDPFAGVGSTGQAARNLERQYILVEEDERYYKRACLRLSKPAIKAIRIC